MKHPLRFFITWIVVDAVAVAILALTGCATTCREPEVRAAQFGTVLECKPQHVQGKADRAACTVSTPDGDRVFHFKVCE
jgi:hypothetical protein